MHTKFSTSRLLSTFKKTFKRLETGNSSIPGALWNFAVPNVKGNESNSFFFHAIKDWNSLPDELKTCENICSFKKGVKRHLIQRTTGEAENVYVFF